MSKNLTGRSCPWPTGSVLILKRAVCGRFRAYLGAGEVKAAPPAYKIGLWMLMNGLYNMTKNLTGRSCPWPASSVLDLKRAVCGLFRAYLGSGEVNAAPPA